METFYVNKMVKSKLTEEDQSFSVGKYEITLYMDAYLSNGKEFYLLDIHEFNEDDDVVDSKNLYVVRTERETYPKAWECLHNENYVASLMNRKWYERITVA